MYPRLPENIETIITHFGSNPNRIIQGLTDIVKNSGCDINNAKRWAPYVTPFNLSVVGLPIAVISMTGTGVTANNDTLPYPESEHFVIFGVRVLSGAGAALGSIDWQPGVSDAIAKNGRLSIVNNGDTILKNFPLTTFNPSVNNNDLEAGVYMLTAPFLWRGQTTMEAQFAFPTVVATANASLRLEYLGYKLI